MSADRRGGVPAYWYDDTAVPAHARLLSGLYGAVTGFRRALYRKGYKRRLHPGVPVLVVGNITAGGAGKTPLTIALVQRLKQEGWNPGVASRGYGRDDIATPLWVERDTDPRLGGDEPVLIARRTGAKLRADRDRAAAAKALAEAGCDIVICDDGLQHYRLARDIEIEVVDGRRRYGNGQLLPAGPLREPPERGAQCDFRVVNLAQAATSDPTANAGFGEWPMRLIADQAQSLLGTRPLKLEAFAGQRVHAVAGIGDPERYFSMLRGFGIAVVPHAFPDHHCYVESDFAFGSKLPVLMTEKDAVKIPLTGEGAFASEAYYSVPVRAELPEAFWVSLLDKLQALPRR
ncbi:MULTISPECIES: tetraacyldisaccharide 4'-kinase [Lysobacter]|uniref:tetraacyldisaccharide 4'-kinase n=1 Tax=Lysobacter TaxID=68 RepID=UPI001F2DDAC6|nr:MULTISPECIES: tetraacyldisaccharide 4'-kinase [Lysobacter]UJB21033.1 tetraacyldisaccharide 4'-kinase [Lysobacter capsici]UJQ29852.1 tetraacyldisaccharide 4'-kinase [Lysobacter gummosus]